jgi:hypothetical protein
MRWDALRSYGRERRSTNEDTQQFGHQPAQASRVLLIMTIVGKA